MDPHLTKQYIMLAMIVLASAAITIAWIVALIDILKSKFKNDIDKVIWLLVISFFPIIGLSLYFFISPSQKKGT